MKACCQKIYRRMQEELKLCLLGHDCFEQQVVHCFSTACCYCQLLTELLLSIQFSSDAEEIRFFKTTKPAFTSEMEYYALLYHAFLFAPPRGNAAVLFWGRECRRLENFIKGHASFVVCFRDKGHSLMPYYFLRRYAEAHRGHDAFAIIEVVTNGDVPAARYLELQRYQLFAQEQRSNLGSA